MCGDLGQKKQGHIRPRQVKAGGYRPQGPVKSPGTCQD